MKSRITIEVDFDNGNRPAIFVNHEQSDDIRDKLISAFKEDLGYQSSWCKVDFVGDGRFRITPIKPDELKENSSLMEGLTKHLK